MKKFQLIQKLRDKLRNASPQQKEAVRALLMRKKGGEVTQEMRVKETLEQKRTELGDTVLKKAVEQNKYLQEHLVNFVEKQEETNKLLKEIQEKEPEVVDAKIAEKPEWWERNVKVEVKQEDNTFAIGSILTSLFGSLVTFLSKLSNKKFLVTRAEEDYMKPQKVVFVDPESGKALKGDEIGAQPIVNVQQGSRLANVKIKDSSGNIIDPASSAKQDEIIALQDNYAVRVNVDSGDSNITYVGKAVTGTATSTALWQIMKIDETTGTVITWSDGDDSFDNVYDDRESLTYS